MKPKLKIKTRWFLFECEQGRRWSEVSEASYYDGANPYISKDGDTCGFSGCLADHKIKKVGERGEDNPPYNWLRGWETWEESPRYKSLVG